MGNSTWLHMGRITRINNGLLWLEKVRDFFLFFFGKNFLGLRSV